MRPGRPIQMTLNIVPNASLALRLVSLVDANGSIIEDLPSGKVNIPKQKRFIGSPTAQAQDLAGPNWNGAPMLTGRDYPSPRTGGRTRSISIRNLHTDDDLQISFDRGVNFFTLSAGQAYTGEVSLQFFMVRRSTSAVATDMAVEVVAILV